MYMFELGYWRPKAVGAQPRRPTGPSARLQTGELLKPCFKFRQPHGTTIERYAEAAKN